MSELPIPRPGKVIAVGLNYRDHAAESDSPLPESPILFAKWSTCLVPNGAAVVLPPGVDQADYEAELAVVIGRTATNVRADDALDFVSGYLALNDVSDREAQMKDGQWSRAKSYDTFGPIGPIFVPGQRDSRPADPSRSRVTSTVSGCRTATRRT